MKKYLWFVITILLLIVPILACGGSEPAVTEAPAAQPTEAPAQPTEAPAQPATTEAPAQPAAAETPAQPAATQAPTEVAKQGSVIPAECFASNETLVKCYNEGKIPPQCIDDQGNLKQECINGAGQPQGGEPAKPASGEQPKPAGAMLADSGFRPDKNGLPFPNYGGDIQATNLTPAELQRVYGNQVCARIEGDKCILTPPAGQFMEQWNGAMNGGHCYGFSVTSLRFYQGLLNPADFGAGSISQLQLQGNEKLQREIAYSFIQQGLDSVRASALAGTPVGILDKLIEVLQAKKETYTVAFFKADGTGGHAVTPYAVEDRGGGKVAVLIYDNNYPNTPREIMFDRNANSWQYEASINPNVQSALYQGDASTKSLFLFPTNPGLQQQPCTFCAGGGQARVGGLAAPEPEFNEIWLDGEGDLLIVDEQGNRLGHADGKLVNEIPGARYEVILSNELWDDAQEPVYYVPTNIPFNMTIDGSRLKEETATDVMVIGPGYDLGLEGISLSPGQQDNLIVSTKDDIISYQTQSSESPNIIFGLQREGADYAFEVQGADMEGGGTINAMLTVKDGDLIINATDLKKDGNFALTMTRFDDQGEESYYNDEIKLQSGGIVYVYYAEWKGNGTPVQIGIDSNGDGTIEETYSSADEN